MVVLAGSCLVAFGIMRARTGEGNKVKAMPPMLEGDAVLEIGNGALKVELDGKGMVSELPQQSLRHEMI